MKPVFTNFNLKKSASVLAAAAAVIPWFCKSACSSDHRKNHQSH